MANKKLEEYEKILYGKKSSGTDPKSSLANYKTRIAAKGIDPDEALDKRNWLEKGLNLKQDQNVLFDIFELLNRPQQALFGGLENLQQGEDFLEGAKQGLYGNKDTQFKDILKNTGYFNDREGKLDLVDALGFAGDVFLDPADIVPVAGFGKVSKALDAGDDIFKALRQADSLSDFAFKGIGKGLKGTAKLADTGLETLLKNIDEIKGVRAFDDFGNALGTNAKLLYGNIDQAKRASELMPVVKNEAEFGNMLAKYDKGRLQSYKELKDSVKDIFKKSDISTNAILTKRAAENTADEVRLKLGKVLKDQEDIVKNYAAEHSTDIKNVGEDISLFVESMMDRSIEKDELLDLIRKGKVHTNNEIENALEVMKNQVPEDIRKGLDFSYKVGDDGIIKLTGNGWNEKVLKENGIASFKSLDEANSMIDDYGNWYTDTDIEKIDELRNNQDFRQLINQLFGEVRDGDVIKFDGDNVKILSGADAVQKHRDLFDIYNNTARQKGWTTLDRDYAERYVGNTPYRQINDALNEGRPLDFLNQKTSDAIDKGINLFPSPEDVGLTKFDKAYHTRKAFGLPELPTDIHGKLSPEALQQTADDLQSVIGKKFKVSEGFNSAAVGEGFSYFNSKDTLMYIRAEKGTPMYITNPGEREAILKRAQEYTLRNAEVKDINGMPKLVLTVDIFDENGKKLATLSDNVAANTPNTILDEAFNTNFSRFNEGNASRAWIPHTLEDPTMAKMAEKTNAPILKGRTSLVSPRTRLGSIRENNNLYRAETKRLLESGTLTPSQTEFYKKHTKLFEEDFNKAIANKYFDGMTNLAKQHKIVNDILIDQTFGSRTQIENLQRTIREHTLSGDKEALKKATEEYNKLTANSPVKYLTEFDKNIPSGFTEITPEHAKSIVGKLKNMKKAVGADAEGYNKLTKMFDISKGSVAVNNDVLRMLEVTINPKEKNAILRAYDKVLNLYKSTKTLSFTNSLNNFVGNSSNLYLSGIGPIDQARLMPKAVEISKDGQKLYLKKLAGETLTKREDDIADIWKKFIDTGFGSEEIALDLQDLPDFMKDIAKSGKTSKKITAKEVATALPKWNMKANTYVDNLNRITVMLKSMEDPSYLSRLGIEGANDVEKYRKAISKVMFDPTMMTDTERDVLKRIIPFYTYAKNNLIFQMDNLGRNGSRYNKLVKSIKSLQKSATGNREENMDDYIKDNLYIPIPGLDKDGNYTIIRTQLPFGDLLELANNPNNYFVNKAGPAIKGPFEFATNKNTFSGLDIEKFPGQKSTNIPFLTKKQEKLIGDLTGLDVPAKTLFRTFSSNPLEAVTMTKNINTDQLNRTYEQIEDLQNLMKQYEQKGYEFSTISELRKANKNGTIANIDAIFAKYGVSPTTQQKKSTYSDYEKILYGR